MQYKWKDQNLPSPLQGEGIKGSQRCRRVSLRRRLACGVNQRGINLWTWLLTPMASFPEIHLK